MDNVILNTGFKAAMDEKHDYFYFKQEEKAFMINNK